MKKIGEEITEELEFKPGTLFVNRYIRLKYARPKDEGIAIGMLPSRPIEKGIAGPNTMLKDFSGYVQSDGYSGYNEVAARAEIISVGCMAHARRYFVEALDNDRERGNWMLFRLQILYAVERYARDNQLSFEKRCQLRQKKAAPVMAEIKSWLDVESLKVLPKSAMGKAMGYMLNQWLRLKKYLTDGQLEIDNNLVENAIRPVAMGRKN